MRENKKFIGVCGARIFDQNAMWFLDALKEMGAKRGYYTIAFSANSESYEDTDETLGERHLFELCRHVDFSSLVILTETLKNRTLINQIVEIGKEKHIPVFSVDGTVEGCYNLTKDYKKGFEQIVRHVVEDHGARRVNMLAGFKDNAFSEERVDVYKQVLRENGIDFEEERLGYGHFWDRPSREAVKGFLESSLPKPDAIICANDSMAITACSVLKEHGYKVPDDMMVTGFDGIQQGRYHTPMMATCEPDYQKPLEFIFEEIEKAGRTGEVSPYDCTVEFMLVKSQSCGCTPEIYYDRNGIISTLFEDAGDCTWHNFSMNQMVTSMLNMQKVMEVAEMLPETVQLWNDHFHFACVKSALTDSYDVPEEYSEMVTILRGAGNEEFEKPGEKFPVTDLLPRLDELVSTENGEDILIVRLLNSGKDVYGYLVEGFQELNDRSLQRCNEFAMFLAHSINTVLHNCKLTELNQSLIAAYNEISVLSFQDSMTGVYNRRGFFRQLEERLAKEESFGKYLYIVSIDMNRLKYINDTFGHAEGDFAIISLANAIVKVGGDDAICARFGGDEFACVLFADSPDMYEEKEVSRKIHDAIQKERGVLEKPYPVTASVGLSNCLITKNMNVEALIISADKNMYEDKLASKEQRA